MNEGSDEAPSAVGSAPRSPWEAISGTPSPALAPSELESSSFDSSAQLAPEVETGNVEYKLKLCHPTPERFTRLVTQLKWRLLAGSGQALYEIGVSDSGQLIGLTRKDLDESLDTLERMAGELGATLIIQKEITIPSSPIHLGSGTIGYGQVDGAPRIPRLTPPPPFDAINRNLDISPFSLTDADASSDDLSNKKHGRIHPYTNGNGNVSLALGVVSSSLPSPASGSHNSSPVPIIRNFPAGYDAWRYSNSRAQSSSQISSSLPREIGVSSTSISLTSHGSRTTFGEPDSDFDDDAAFSFDLDINNLTSRATSTNSLPTQPMLIFGGPDEEDGPSLVRPRHTHKPYPSGKHKKPRLLQPPPVDPAEKALERRARRQSKREQRPARAEILGDADSESVHGSSKSARTSQSRQSASDSESPSEVGTGSIGPEGLRSDEALGNGDASAPRLIVEALVVRKFTVEVEETYLEFDKLRL